MSWITEAQKSIFPLSLEKENLKIALEEWGYFGTVYDAGYADKVCELCQHPEIRYQFQISNRNNGNVLWIGSECITKFGEVAVYDQSGKIADRELARKKVASDKGKLITEAKIKAVINSLIALGKVDEDFGKQKIDSFISFYQERGAFTPLQLSTLIWRLSKFNVDFKPQYLKMSIMRKPEREQLLTMEDWRIRKIYRALSATQKQFLLRHRPELFKRPK